MTCIVGVTHEGRTYLGGDSMVSIGRGQWRSRVPKVVTRGAYVVGAAGECAWVDAFLGLDCPRTFSPNWVPNVLPKLLRQALAKLDKKLDGQALIGARGQLWNVDENGAVDEPIENYSAIGSAWLVALGSLFTTEWQPAEPSRRVELALSAAAQHHAQARSPFHVVQA